MTSKTVDSFDDIFMTAMGKLNKIQGFYNRAKSTFEIYKAKIAVIARITGANIQTTLDEITRTIETQKEKRELLIAEINKFFSEDQFRAFTYFSGPLIMLVNKCTESEKKLINLTNVKAENAKKCFEATVRQGDSSCNPRPSTKVGFDFWISMFYIKLVHFLQFQTLL